MTDDASVSPASPKPSRWRFLPELRSRWWTLLLGLSLMLNLLVGGVVLGSVFGGFRDERIVGHNAMQIMPRAFLMDLPRERRRELLGTVRQDMRALRGYRDGSAENILKIAAVLDAQPDDINAIQAAVMDYATGPNSVAIKTTTLIMNVIGKMSVEERKQLAAAIRERANRALKKK